MLEPTTTSSQYPQPSNPAWPGGRGEGWVSQYVGWWQEGLMVMVGIQSPGAAETNYKYQVSAVTTEETFIALPA